MGETPQRALLVLLASALAAALAYALLQGGGERTKRGALEPPAEEVRAVREPRPARREPARTAAPLEEAATVPAEAESAPQAALESGAGVLPETTLLVEATSLISGALEDPQGRAVGGLPLHWRTASWTGWSTTSDAFGAFQLSGLPRGPGELLLGDPNSPVAAPRPLEVAASRTDIGTIEVPPLGELSILVFDEQGQPAAEVVVSGVGDGGGSIVERTTLDGLAHARFLPRGMYRVFASHPELGRGNTVFEYFPEGTAPVEVRLRRAAPRD